MCNRLHKDFRWIPKTGTGWKFFIRNSSGQLLQAFSNMEYETADGKSIVWNDEKDPKTLDIFGFCFFDEKPSKRLLDEFERDFISARYKVVLKKIKYSEGLGKVIERNMTYTGPVEVCLCKKFELLPDDRSGDHF